MSAGRAMVVAGRVGRVAMVRGRILCDPARDLALILDLFLAQVVLRLLVTLPFGLELLGQPIEFVRERVLLGVESFSVGFVRGLGLGIELPPSSQ